MQSFKRQFGCMNDLMYEIATVKNKNRKLCDDGIEYQYFYDEDNELERNKYSIAGRGRRKEIKEAKRIIKRGTRLAIKRMTQLEIKELIN